MRTKKVNKRVPEYCVLWKESRYFQRANLRQHTIFILCCILSSFIVQAQPKADFTADVTGGCSPILVNFQNLSTGVDAAAEYFWDLGNGATSTLKDPAATYLTPGVYSVSLRVTTTQGKDSLARQAYVSVYAKPQVAFEATMRAGCAPTVVQFEDMSIPAPGTTNATWSWDFGDGTSSSEPNPTHVYSTPGSYSITLSVTSDKGCSDLRTEGNYINIVQGVVPQFTNTQQTVCKPPVKITFTNTSTGPETLSYLWDFGDGQTSTEANPSISYNRPGTFPVKLVVRSSLGCSDSVVVPNAVIITAAQINTNFQVPPVCANTAIQLTDSSSAVPLSRLWLFSDGTTDTSSQPIKTFTSLGTYTITLVNNYGACTDTVSKTLELGPDPVIDFTASPQNSCKLPLLVSFTNNTANGVSYQWNFGDSTVSSEKDPAHTYTANGSYAVTLITANGSGCADTLTKPAYINIQQPVVYLKKLPERGCIPYTTQFFDSVISADPIISYIWNLGDGTTSTEKAPTHTYTKQGTYPVSLTIQTASGCTASATVPNGVKAGTKPGTVDFTLDYDTVCASQPIQFKDLSVNVDEWDWSFGDGTSSNEKNPSHLFSNIGQDTVKLTAYNSGCKGEVAKKFVTIKPPLAIFSYSPVSCADRFTYNFVNASLTGGSASLTWKWDFGDGTTSDQQDPGPHTYPDLGTYTVSLLVTEGDCSYTAIQTIAITPRTTDFTADRTGCKPFNTVFTPGNIGNSQIVAYTWNFGDGSTGVSTDTVGHTYSASGDYDVSLITTDIYGCNDTSAVKAKYIRVNGPIAKFTATNTKGCKNLTPTFIDESTTDGQNAITSWQWDFGDGTQQTFTVPPFAHTYKEVGRYAVKLTVQDASGCSDSLRYPDYVKTSELKTDWKGVEKTCPGAPVQFTSVVNTVAYSSFWDFGNGATSTDPAPTIVYQDTGTFTIKLVVADSLGCKDSVIRPYYTQVYRPKASFTENNLTSYCVPFQAQFTNTSTYISTSLWDLGISTSTQTNPVSYYTQTGTYNIKLTVTSPGGCMDSIQKTLHVFDIRDATLDYGPTTSGCRPITVTFNAFTEMKGQFIWDFGDGTVVDTTVNKMAHSYDNTGTFTPKIILKEPSGCVVALTGSAPIQVNGAKVKFGIDKKFFCDSGLVTIFDSTVAEGANVSYKWDFGDGTVSTEPNPSTHFYNTPGWHPLTLTVQTGEGCIDTASIRPGVRITVTPRIHISGDSIVCINTEIQSAGVFDRRDSSEITWQWLFADGRTASVQEPPPMLFTELGSYPIQAIATTSDGCADTAYKTLVVRPRLIGTATFPASLTTQAGFPVKLEGTYPPNIQGYTWSPAEGLSCTDCPFPFASPSSNTRYHVRYVDNNNCSDTASVRVLVFCKEANVFVPNTFSPNGDGRNDVFYVRGQGLRRVKSLRIFNRWGEVVFEKRDFAVNDPSVGWDGRFKGGNPVADVYVYQLEVFCGNSDLFRFDGNVALIK